MSHDVFISYSSKDKSAADAVCATLENRRFRCWIAPRDVPPGQPYAAALVSAIKNSKVFVLILSEGSNASGAVMRELEEAVDSGIPILPFRIEEIEPTEAIRYYIKPIHWIDALNPPLEEHLDKLAEAVQANLSVITDDIPSPGSITPAEVPVKKQWALPKWATTLLVLGIIIITAGGAWFASTKLIPTPDKGATSTTEGDTTDLTDWDDWQSVEFNTHNPQIWMKGDDQLTAVKQHDVDAFAWSEETFEGDLIISLEMRSLEQAVDLDHSEMENQFPYLDSGCVILYGEAPEFSQGCLIFCVNWDGYYLEKHSHYLDEYPLSFVPITPFNQTDKVYSVTIEISGDLAIITVNGYEVLSTSFDPKEIDNSGRIGLFRNWAEGAITFSNIRIKLPAGSGD